MEKATARSPITSLNKLPLSRCCSSHVCRTAENVSALSLFGYFEELTIGMVL